MSKSKADIYHEKEKLRVEHEAKTEAEKAKRDQLIKEIDLSRTNLTGINTEISNLSKKTQQFEGTIDAIRKERETIKKTLADLQTVKSSLETEQISLKDQQKSLVLSIKSNEQQISKIKTQDKTKNASQSSDEVELGKKIASAKERLTALKLKTNQLQQKLSTVNKQLQSKHEVNEDNIKRQEKQIKQIKEVNELIARLTASAESLKLELSTKQGNLKKLEHENQVNFEKRAELISYLPKMSDEQTLHISNEGLEHILKNFDPQCPQKNFNWVADYRVELPVKVKKTGLASRQPETIIDIWKKTLENFADLPALTYQTEPDKWKSISFKEYYNECIRFGKACLSLGLTDYTVVMIMGFNSPEWVISFFGAMFARYLPVGNYTTNSPQVCEYLANHSQGEMVVVENEMQLKKYYGIIDRCPKLKYFVVYKEDVPKNLPAQFKGRVFSWNEFLTRGDKYIASRKEDTIEHRQAIQRPGNCATFIYTSGTTGMPKAVMTSHDNCTYMAEGININFKMNRPSLYGKGRVMSYLPLSHVAAQLIDLFLPLKNGFNVFFPDASVLQANMVKFLNVVRPTAFLGVPRVWEKIQEKLGEGLSSATGMKKKLVDWAMSIGIEGTFAQINNKPTPRGWGIAKKLFFSKLKNTLGLDECQIFLFGAAPMKETTRKFFLQLNFFLNNNYGMSESSGPHTFTDASKWKEFSEKALREAGSSILGGEIGLEDQDKEGKGEICMRGRHIFMGYFKNEEETKKTLTKGGFLRSGDEGMLDEEGNLYITGRLKELIVTAGGQNVPPVLIENEITTALPIVSQAVVIGDKMKYLSVLLCLKLKNATDLTDEVVQFLKKHGSEAKTVKDAIKCPKVKDIINKGIEQANKKAISNAQRVQRYTILPLEFTIDLGVLTPTMKVKRKVVNEMFKAEIESMYIDSKL